MLTALERVEGTNRRHSGGMKLTADTCDANRRHKQHPSTEYLSPYLSEFSPYDGLGTDAAPQRLHGAVPRDGAHEQVGQQHVAAHEEAQNGDLDCRGGVGVDPAQGRSMNGGANYYKQRMKKAQGGDLDCQGEVGIGPAKDWKHEGDTWQVQGKRHPQETQTAKAVHV